MKLLMLCNRYGTEDGFSIKYYKRNMIYDIESNILAKQFLDRKQAIIVKEEGGI